VSPAAEVSEAAISAAPGVSANIAVLNVFARKVFPLASISAVMRRPPGYNRCLIGC
jgi:hypothetical protein